MEKLEDYKKYIGKYIRNQYGIAKIIDVFEQDGIIYLKLDKYIVFDVDRKDGNIILNHALRDTYPITEYTQNLDERIKPLIELIESGDYVNGYKVIDKFTDPFIGVKKIRVDFINRNWQGDASDEVYSNEDIKSIVTHEQFEKMKYIV